MKKIYLATIMLLALTACGGGGGGTSGGGGNTTPSIALSTSTLNFATANPGSTPSSQNITATISGNISGTLYIRVVSAGAAVAQINNIQITGSNTGQATVVPASASTLGPGVYTSTITVTACTSDPNCTSAIIGTPQTVNVTYTVSGLMLSATSLSYVITANSPDADYVRQFQLRAYPDFTIASTLLGLSVTPSSGPAGTYTINVAFNRVETERLFSGITNTALSLSTSSGSLQTILVTLDHRRPQITYAAPHVEPANTSGTTILRGLYLDQVNIGSIRFGNVVATSFSVQSPTEIRVVRPPLPQGTYAVQFADSNGVTIDRSLASLVTVPALGAPAQVLSYPDSRARRVTDLVFDAERRALVLGVQYPASGQVSSELLRYVYNGTWSGPTVRPLPYLSSIAMKTDGNDFLVTALINGATQNSVMSCTFDLASCGDNLVWQANTYRVGMIGMTNDGAPLLIALPAIGGASGGIPRYSLWKSILQEIIPYSTYNGILAASGDGSRVVIASNDGTGSRPLYMWNASLPGIVTSPLTALAMDVTDLSLNRTGSKVLVNRTRVYDNTFTLLGSLPASTLSALVSADGTRAYVFDADMKLHTYDLAAMPVAGLYPEIGSAILLQGDPGAGTNGVDMKMALSPDERTLVMAGRSVIVVQPLP